MGVKQSITRSLQKSKDGELTKSLSPAEQPIALDNRSVAAGPAISRMDDALAGILSAFMAPVGLTGV
jgi:hypothetical protein